MSRDRPFVILRGQRYLKTFSVVGRLTVGSEPDCGLCINDERVDRRWGVLFERGGKVFGQREGGAAQAIEPGDAVTVGPYTLVHAGRRTQIERLIGASPPGTKLTWDKEPYKLVVLVGGADSFRPGTSQSGGLSRPAGLQRPQGLMRSPWGNRSSAAAAAGPAVGGSHFDCEPVMSREAERCLAAIMRNLERQPTGSGEIERVGQEFLDDLRALTFPEIVAVLRRLATGWDENYLELLYERILAASPMLSFRWAAIIVERYAAAARGAGADVALPRLSIGIAKYVSGDAADGFRKARERGGKMVARGPW